MNTPASQPVTESAEATRYRETLAALPLANVPLACDMLERVLLAMQKTPPTAVEYLALLESVRDPLSFLLDTLSARYAAKPLPAADAETSAFVRTIGLWRLMADSYARVAQFGSGNSEVQQQLALICQRCIQYIGQVIVEYFRARREVAPGLWLELHGYYDTADEWGLATEPVADPLVAGGTATSAQTYAGVLLVGLSNPYSRTPRELGWIIRWALLLASDTRVVRPDDEAGGRGYGVDLMQDKGLLPVDHLAATHSARLFETKALAGTVKLLFARIKAGETPEAVGLGSDCSAANASRLLLQLYRPWCLAAMPRRFERNWAAGILPMAYGMECIYFHVTGGDFTQPQHARTYSRMDADKLWTFRNQMDPTQPLHLRAAELGYALDTWDVVDQSLNGFRIVRNAAGPRIEHGQLIAIKAPGSDQFTLARFTWLISLNNSRLEAGVQVLPSPATGVGVRQTGAGISPNEQYARGFFVPPVTALKEPLSVIIPCGWHYPDRLIEVFTDRSVIARLGELLSRGPNFDRCAFTLVT
jgi:cyclic-di-GMP-binding protein